MSSPGTIRTLLTRYTDSYMDCPICASVMHLERTEKSNNPDTGKKYDKKVYVCNADDVWVVTEIPTK